MKENTSISKQHNEFGRKILSIIAQVHPYVKHRLYTAETRGVIPHNMYSSSGIIDDAIVKLYEKYEGKLSDDQEIKLKLFSIVSQRLTLLFKKEAFHKETMSTNLILEDELKLLEEKMEMDVNDDLSMKEDLDDISYHQADFKKPMYLYADAEKNIINTLDMHDSRIEIDKEKRMAFNKVYNWLPLKTSNVLDLFVFGKLSYEEIAQIKGVDAQNIKKTIQAVGKTFRKNLN